MTPISQLVAVSVFAVLVAALSPVALSQAAQGSVAERQQFRLKAEYQTPTGVEKTFELLERIAECTAALVFVQTYADESGEFALSKDASYRVRRLMHRFDSIADGITQRSNSGTELSREEWIGREMLVYKNLSKDQRYNYIREVLEVNSCLALSEEE
jgi:hypothetical protein